MTDWKEKYPIGSQWKTKGGWKAVVVVHDDNPDSAYKIRAFHVKSYGAVWHQATGKSEIAGNDKPDLIEPWEDPRKGVFWLVVDIEGRPMGAYLKESEAAAAAKTYSAIACVKVNWTEGEGV